MNIIAALLQDPPEIISKLVKKWREGFDVVIGVRESRCEKIFKKIMIKCFYYLVSRFSDVPMNKQAGMFSLLDRKVVDELNKFKEKNKYYVGLRSFVGFKQTYVPYNRDKRYAGNAKQSIRKLINYALNAFFSFSFVSIRLLSYFGLFILLVISVPSTEPYKPPSIEVKA